MHNYLTVRYFMEIARCLNFSQAAQNLNISQPGLSQQINALERELGFKLFYRTTRKVTLTEEGEYLYRNLLPSYDNIDRTLTELKKAGAVPRSKIRIAAVPSAASTLVPKLIERLKEKYAELEFHLKEATSVQAIDMMQKSECHLAFIRTPIDTKHALPKPLQWMEFARHPLQVAVSRHHWAAERTSIRLSELKNETFLHYDRDSSPSLYYFLESACLAAGFIPKTIGSGPEILTRATLISHGFGITLLPRDMIELLYPYGIVGIALEGSTMSSSLSAVWNAMNVPMIVADALDILQTIREEQTDS